MSGIKQTDSPTLVSLTYPETACLSLARCFQVQQAQNREKNGLSEKDNRYPTTRIRAGSNFQNAANDGDNCDNQIEPTDAASLLVHFRHLSFAAVRETAIGWYRNPRQ